MNEKKLYENPEMEIIRFKKEDVITASHDDNELPGVPL